MREPTIKKKVFIKTNDVETNIYFNQLSIISLGDIENNGVNNKKNKDNARPETIAYMCRLGYKVKPCEKWAGSVEGGIEYLRSFKKIIIHPRCKNLIKEMGLYSYKTDRLSGEVLPVPIDKNNHWQDSLRYSLTEYVKKKRKPMVLEF